MVEGDKGESAENPSEENQKRENITVVLTHIIFTNHISGAQTILKVAKATITMDVNYTANYLNKRGQRNLQAAMAL